MRKILLSVLFLLTTTNSFATEIKMTASAHPKVKLSTSLGTITLQLNAEKAPISTQNFLTYVKEGFYNGTLFHRVIKDFMAQGGGFDVNFSQKETHESIENEADNGLKNVRGSIAMARTNIPNSATAQVFYQLQR
jgi:peptidyl-prolyl cis-trans isomerase B (cyclophilin B)